jgi:hypothetical protein
MSRTAFQQIGDVDVGARVRVFDRLDDTTTALAIRQTFGVTYRIGSGHHDQPDNFIDVGTGSGADAVGLRSFTDLRLRDRIWTTLTVGVIAAQPYEREMRVPTSNSTSGWLEAITADRVQIDPGAMFEIGIAPRWQLSDHFLLGAEWRWRDKAADRHTLTGAATRPSYGETLTLQPGVLDAQSAWDETRLAWSVSYSTLSSAEGDRGRLPIEIGYTHEQTVSNANGIVPQRFTDRIQIRYYARFFGR